MRVLLISTWYPYPPIQGSKTRAYHLLRALARNHQVALLTFEDVPIQPAWREHLLTLCRQVQTVPRAPFTQSARGRVRGWFSALPSSVVAGYSPEMASAADSLAREWAPDCVVALTFVAAPYALQVKSPCRVLDVDNLTGEMLREEATRAPGRARRLRLNLASRKFARYEAGLCRDFDLALVTSHRDAARLQASAGLPSARIAVVPNGVDLIHFQPGSDPVDSSRLIFTGAVTYEPNFDAVRYFVDQMLPTIRARVPEATLMVTGSTEGVPVDGLTQRAGVCFTGFVEDLRPVVRQCAVCVVPLRKGGGTRLKVLEAMALGTPVVSTAKGVEGLELEDGRELLIEDEPLRFAEATLRLMGDPQLRADLAARALERVQREYRWDQIGSELLAQVEAIGDGRSDGR